MPIPPEILAVERPTNTRVLAYGKNKNLYSVIQRVGCDYKNGKRIPRYGPTIGHIVNGKFVPVNGYEPIQYADIDIKNWGNILLCDKLFRSMMDFLLQFYNLQDTLKLYCITILRVCFHDIRDYQLDEKFNASFLSEFYPNAALSKDTVSKFWQYLGRSYSIIRKFMQKRSEDVGANDLLLINGTLKTDDSNVNTLANYSHKVRKKDTQDVSILYAFDLDKMEPICSKCYPGNMLDVTSYDDFLADNKIIKGTLIGDKGFPYSSIEEYHKQHPGLNYINPLKRNTHYIDEYNLLEYDGVINVGSFVEYKKVKCDGIKKYLYSFREHTQASSEEISQLQKYWKNGGYNFTEMNSKKSKFGTIILESDLDIAPRKAYLVYNFRWQIEIVMRYYKVSCGFNDTGVHDDYSVIGSEFCNFLATVLTYRLINKFEQVGLLENYTYKEIMDTLKGAKKVRELDGEWRLLKLNPSKLDILRKLDIIPKPKLPTKKKSGRPPKSKV